MAEVKDEIKSSCSTEKKDIQKDFMKCLHFAALAHKKQKRKDFEKTPYINHPIGVAYILSEEAGITNLNLIEGCLLHDTVEDTDVKVEEIKIKFGNYVSDLVAEVTDDKALPKQERKNLQIIHAKTTSPQGKLVKLADKLYNLRDLERSLPEGWSEERRCEYFQWAFRVCEGLRGVSPKLEEKLDRIFKTKDLISQNEVYDQLHTSQDWPYHNELKPLICAANFAAEKHRKNYLFNASTGIPYINHVVSVALIISEEADKPDPHLLTSALLLDVVGRTDATVEEVSLRFGHEVGKLVTELACELSDSFEEKLKKYVDRVAGFSHNAKIIVLATITDICQNAEQYYTSRCLPGNLCATLVHLRTLLTDTLPPLEQKLDQITSQQGIKQI